VIENKLAGLGVFTVALCFGSEGRTICEWQPDAAFTDIEIAAMTSSGL
jgi:hypothetical protein